jgi:hypothetical protein
MLFRHKAAAVALLALLLTATAAQAQQVSGVVKDVYPGPGRLVVTGPDGAAFVFKMDEDAQVYVNDQHAQLDDLRPGDRVQVIYRVDEAELLAIEIRCWR